MAVGTREELGHPDYRAVDTSHLGDRIEDDVVDVAAGVKNLAIRSGTLISWRQQHVSSLNLIRCTVVARELIFRPLGALFLPGTGTKTTWALASAAAQ